MNAPPYPRDTGVPSLLFSCHLFPYTLRRGTYWNSVPNGLVAAVMALPSGIQVPISRKR